MDRLQRDDDEIAMTGACCGIGKPVEITGSAYDFDGCMLSN